MTSSAPFCIIIPIAFHKSGKKPVFRPKSGNDSQLKRFDFTFKKDVRKASASAKEAGAFFVCFGGGNYEEKNLCSFFGMQHGFGSI